MTTRWRYLLPLIVLWLAFGLRLYRLDWQSMWWDEGHSIFVASQPLAHIPTLPAMDVHPPAYFALLHLWLGLVGQSEFALRYLSVIFSMVTLALLWRFAASVTHHLSLSVNRIVMRSEARPRAELVAARGRAGSSFSAAVASRQTRDDSSENNVSVSKLNFDAPDFDTPDFHALGGGGVRYAQGHASQLLSLPFLTMLLAAISPFYVTYAQEVRSYALITCLALGSTFALWQIISGKRYHLNNSGVRTYDKEPKKWLILYIILTTAGLYTHYFTIFLLLFQNLVWIGWIRYNQLTTRRNLPKTQITLWLISQIGTFLLFLPQLWLALRQVTTYTNPNLLPPTLCHFISRSWQAYTVGLTLDPTPARWGMWGILGIVLISNLVINRLCELSALRKKSSLPCHFEEERREIPAESMGISPVGRNDMANTHNPSISNWSAANHRPLRLIYGFLVAWFVIPLAAYFLVLQRQPSFEPRYMALITPALVLLLALSLTAPISYAIRNPVLSLSVPASRRGEVEGTQYVLRFTFYTLTLILLLIFTYSLHSYYTNETYFKDDSAGVAHWLAAETTPNDIVYVDVPHPFHYYVERSHIPAPTTYLFVDIHTAADQLKREAAGRNRLYWVTWSGSDTDPRGVIPFLAEKAGIFAGQRDFRGYHVQWFDLLPEAQFDLPTTLQPVAATFGEVVRLDGLAYGETTTPGNPAWVTLHYTLLRETEVNYKASLRLRAATGQIIAQLDRDLLNDRHFRTAAWPLSDPTLNQALNVYTLPLPPETAPGSYQLELVIYNADPPYPSEGVSGLPSAEGVSAILGNITLTLGERPISVVQ